MNLSSIRIVLVATSHPGNIGSAARAMKTMGFGRLYLVNPEFFPDLNACEMAAGADDVLNNSVVTKTLDEALAGCNLVIATSARPRGLSLPGLSPRDCASFVAGQARDTEVAFVFGRERSGLTNEELLRCHYHLNIPANPDYSSLNLSQAVQIIVYELRMALLQPQAKVAHHENELATFTDVENFYKHLGEVLDSVNFLKPHNPHRVQQRLRRLFNRAGLEQIEVAILRGILSHVQKALEKEHV